MMPLLDCKKTFDDICIPLDTIPQRGRKTEMVKQYRILGMLIRNKNRYIIH